MYVYMQIMCMIIDTKNKKTTNTTTTKHIFYKGIYISIYIYIYIMFFVVVYGTMRAKPPAPLRQMMPGTTEAVMP